MNHSLAKQKKLGRKGLKQFFVFNAIEQSILLISIRPKKVNGIEYGYAAKAI